MKKRFLKFSYTFFFLTLLISSCKKHSESIAPDDTQQQSTIASDESSVSTESDAALEDANLALSGSSYINGRVAAGQLVCGATINYDTANKKIMLVYDGVTSCGNRIRTGSMVIQLMSGVHWKDKNSLLKIVFSSYKVTWANKKTLTLTGEKYIKNLTGGSEKDVLSGRQDSVMYSIRALAMTLTFNDGTSREWGAARTKTFKKIGGDYYFTVNGDSVYKSVPHVAYWGTSRSGAQFEVVIPVTVVLSSCLDASNQANWKLISGQKIHRGFGKDITVTYGVKADGSADGSCNSYGYKAEWTNAQGVLKDVLISY